MGEAQQKIFCRAGQRLVRTARAAFQAAALSRQLVPNLSTYGRPAGTCSCYANNVHGIKFNGSNSSSGIEIHGISVITTTKTAAATVNIYNNFISDINYTGSSGGHANIYSRGINLADVSGSTLTANVYFNSIYLSGTTTQMAACLVSGVTGGTPVITLENNIFKNGEDAENILK